MFIKYRHLLTVTIGLFGLVACSSQFSVSAADSMTTIGNKTQIVAGNKTLEVENGFIYDAGDNRRKIDQLYDPDFVRKSYTKENGKVFRIVPGYGKLAVQRTFSENFESGNTIKDLIGPGVNWTSMTIQGKASPNVKKYVELRHQILSGDSDFKDNEIAPSTRRKHSGSKSLRTFAKHASFGVDVNKASIDTELVYFTKGDDFWFSGWFFIEKGKPTSIIDLESTYMVQAPGIRMMLDDDMRPSVELKFAYKPTFTMDPKVSYSFPTGRWVKVRMHVYLMDSEAGRVRLWIDNRKLIDQTGRTLTLFDAVYNSLQVGITASPPSIETVMFVDDVRISDVGL